MNATEFIAARRNVRQPDDRIAEDVFRDRKTTADTEGIAGNVVKVNTLINDLPEIDRLVVFGI